LDTFWERVTTAIHRLNDEDFDMDTREALATAKTDIKAAIAARFGKAASNAAVPMKRSISGWNLFDSENRQQIREELRSSGCCMYLLGQTLRVASDFEHVTKELSSRWKTADQDLFRARAKRKAQEMDDMREEGDMASKRRRRNLWNGMKKSVVLRLLD
jgi:hypothetical protein